MSDKSFIENIRQRPSMYIGAKCSIGVGYLVGELISNAIDQYVLGHSTQYTVYVEEDQIRVLDDGIGMPFDVTSDATESSAGQSLVEKSCTVYHRTPTEDGHTPHIHIHSMCGVGLAVVNSLSALMRIRSWRNGKLWEQSFSRGKIASDARIIDVSKIDSDEELKIWNRGTELLFKPDKEIFSDSVLDRIQLRGWMFQSAHLFAGLKVRLDEEVFVAPNGLADLATTLTPVYGVNRGFRISQDSDLFRLELFAWRNAANTNSRAMNAKLMPKFKVWVNGRPTIRGSHLEPLLNAFLESGWKPKEVFCHLIMKEPEFAGPTRQVLEADHIKEPLFKMVREAVKEHLMQEEQSKKR